MTAKTSLKRSLKLPTVTFYGVGAILGAGIYVLIGEVAGVAGYYAPLSFLLAALIALFSAYSYAELSARYPQSAGEAVYIAKAFNNRPLTQLIGLMVIFTGIVSAATMATGVIGYVQIFLDWRAVPIVFLFILLVGLVALWGIEESAWVVVVITLIELSGLVVVVAVSATDILEFSVVKQFENPFSDFTISSGIFLGSFIAFYAYIGFEDMVNIAEEMENPEKVLPKAIILALAISTTIYIAVSYAAISVLTPTQLASSKAPLADVIIAKGYSASWIGLVSLIAVVNGAIVQLIMASRVIYGMGKQKLLPITLSHINATTATPVRATLLCIAVTLILALAFPLSALAQATSIIVLAVFTLVNLALIRINSYKTNKGTVHFPLWVPVIGAGLCLLILALKQPTSCCSSFFALIRKIKRTLISVKNIKFATIGRGSIE